jgi:uncharacterized protein
MSGYGRRRGRCRGMRWVNHPHDTKDFTPDGYQQPQNTIILKIYELEALRLVDLEDLTQEEAAAMMGVSRKTLWNDLQKARKKVINALVNGYQISIQGNEHIQRNEKEVNKEDARWRQNRP